MIPAAAASRGRWPRPSDGFGRYSELVGWSADGKKLYFTEAQAHEPEPARPAAARVRPRRSATRTACPPAASSSTPAARTSASPGRRWSRAPEAFVAAVDRLRADPGQPGQQPRFAGRPAGRTEVDPLEIEGRPGNRGPADLPGRLREGQALSAAAHHPRRPDGGVHADLRRHGEPIIPWRRSRRGATPCCGPTRAAAAATARSSATPTTATGAAATFRTS